MTSDSTAARSRRYGARGSSRIDDPVEYDEPANDDADDLDEYDDDDDFVAVAAQVAATAAHASRTSRVARSSSIASGVVDPSPPPHRDPTEPGSERAAADEEDDDDPTRDARVSSRGPATAREVDSYSDERPRDKRIVDDLDDLLARGDGFRHRLAGGLLFHPPDEIACDGERDIGLQKRHAHLAQGGFHVLFGERTLLGQPVEHAGEAIGQVFEHRGPPRAGCCHAAPGEGLRLKT